MEYTLPVWLLDLVIVFFLSEWAEWVYVTEGLRHQVFIDTATIKRTGDNRRVWELKNLNEAFKGGMSFRALAIYDCKNEKKKTLTLSIHLEPMAQGETLDSINNENSEWEYIAPRTVDSEVLHFVCAPNKSK
jgi:hypothetical protein